MKNSIANHSEAFIRERQRELDFIKNTPYYGSPMSEKLYNTLKNKYNILQVGVCGKIVSVVHYKQDSDTMLHILSKMFEDRRVLQKTSKLTELVTTYTLP